MFVKGNLRVDPRRSFVKILKYSVGVPGEKKLTPTHETAVTVDISKGGIGILTTYPLTEGQVLIFSDEIIEKDVKARSAVVRWSGRINGDRYRVGLKFI